MPLRVHSGVGHTCPEHSVLPYFAIGRSAPLLSRQGAIAPPCGRPQARTAGSLLLSGNSSAVWRIQTLIPTSMKNKATSRALRRLAVTAALALAPMTAVTLPANAATTITNGGFETGSLSGW